MVSFTAFVAVAALCASIANAAPLPNKDAAKATTTSCSTSSKPTTTHHTKTHHKNPKSKPTTSCSTTSKAKKYKPTTTHMAKKMKATTTSCTTSKAKATTTSCTTTSKAKATTTYMAKKMTTTTSCTTSSSSTSMAAMTYSTPSYGSGMSNWNKGNGYNDCVQQCIVKNGGMKMGSYQKPTATMKNEYMSMGSKGTGATHTVIVAPSQGVLRYVPMAVNASVGDTIKFVWGANNHTVTKGSQLEPCNKTKDALFTSGSQNKGFTFTQVVNDTKPTFFFCNTPGHCQKGMFGIINPANNFGAPSCAKKMMPKMMKDSPTLASMDAYMKMMDSKTDSALNWGNNLDLDALPSWAQESFGENIMFTRSFLAANPDVMDKSGKVDLGQVGDAPFVVPKDLASAPSFAATANTQQNLPVVVDAPSSSVKLVSASASASATSTFTPVSLVTATSTPTPAPRKSSGALTVRSQAGVVGVIATIAAFIII